MFDFQNCSQLTVTASYPLYAATFASSKPGVLVVGGGGGAGRHGVKNKISVFDFTSRAPNVEPVAEIEASQDDSVQSLAGLGTKDGLIVYAGGCDHGDKGVGMRELC
jgi:hypothetical protein